MAQNLEVPNSHVMLTSAPLAAITSSAPPLLNCYVSEPGPMQVSMTSGVETTGRKEVYSYLGKNKTFLFITPEAGVSN